MSKTPYSPSASPGTTAGSPSEPWIMEKHDDCDCLRIEFKGGPWTFLGYDNIHASYGEVRRFDCPECGRHWLHYSVEYEEFRSSGRSYRAVVAPEVIETITPSTAAAAIAASSYCIYGGAFFGGVYRIRREPGEVVLF